jgi:hypothetical protein
LNFKQAFLNTAERQNIVKQVAFVLSLFPNKVQERKYIIYRRLEEEISGFLSSSPEPEEITEDPAIGHLEEFDGEGRKLQQATSTLIYLQLIANPDSSVYPSPVAMASLLNDRSAQLTSLLTNFDTSYYIQGTAFNSYVPSFASPPLVDSFTWQWAAFKGRLSQFGWIYLVLVPAAKDFGKPTPFQITNGLDSKNIQMPSGMVEIAQSYTDYPINVTNIEPNTEYNVYVVAGSAHPGFPDLMPSSGIVTLTFTSSPKPESKFLKYIVNFF